MHSFKERSVSRVFFLLLLGGLAWAPAQKEAPPASPVTALTAVPADALYTISVPSAPGLMEMFYAGHLASFDFPLAATASKRAAAGSALTHGPHPTPPPLSHELYSATFAHLTTDVFFAWLPGGGVLAGGQTPDPAAAVAALQKAAGSGWTTESFESWSLLGTHIAGTSIWLVSSAPWVVLGTDKDAVKAALARLAGTGSGSLRDLPAYQTTRGPDADHTLVELFVRVDLVRDTLPDGPLKTLLHDRLGGLDSFFWRWASEGPGSIGRDFFAYGLDPALAPALVPLMEPLGEGWKGLPGPDTVVAMPWKIRLSTLASTPALAGLPAASLLAALPVAGVPADDLVHGLFLVDQPGDDATQTKMGWMFRRADFTETTAATPVPLPAGTAFAARRPGFLILAATPQEADYFANRPSAPAPLLALESLPGVPGPFAQYLVDRPRIARHFASALNARPDAWKTRLQSLDLPVPDTISSEALVECLPPYRAALALDGSVLRLTASYQLPKTSGSTFQSVTATIAAVADPARFASWQDRILSLLRTPDDSSDATIGNLLLVSDFLEGPLAGPTVLSLFNVYLPALLMTTPDLPASP